MKCSDEISIGEYVRLKNGKIIRFEKFGIYRTHTRKINGKYETGTFENKCIISGRCHYKYDNIVKHSKNIIDLAEEGDVIEINNKKYEVIFDKSYEKLGLLIPNRDYLAIRHCSLEYIFSNEGRKEFESISIITKEQIKQIEYVIKE